MKVCQAGTYSLFSSVLDNRDDTSMLPLAAYYDKNADPSVYVVLTHDTTFLFLFVIYIYTFFPFPTTKYIHNLPNYSRHTQYVRKKGRRERLRVFGRVNRVVQYCSATRTYRYRRILIVLPGKFEYCSCDSPGFLHFPNVPPPTVS